MKATADLADEHGDHAQVCELELRQFGAVRSFGGEIATIRCFEDNVLVKQRVSEPGNARVPTTFRPGATLASDDDGIVVLD